MQFVPETHKLAINKMFALKSQTSLRKFDCIHTSVNTLNSKAMVSKMVKTEPHTWTNPKAYLKISP